MNEDIGKIKSKENLGETESGAESEGGVFNYQQEFENLKARVNNLSDKVSAVDGDFIKLEKRIDKTNTFMMWAMGIAITVFIGSGILVTLDYFNNNEQRYENFINKIEEIKNDFYSKDDLKNLIDENSKDKQILYCLKNKGYFTLQCFNQ